MFSQQQQQQQRRKQSTSNQISSGLLSITKLDFRPIHPPRHDARRNPFCFASTEPKVPMGKILQVPPPPKLSNSRRQRWVPPRIFFFYFLYFIISDTSVVKVIPFYCTLAYKKIQNKKSNKQHPQLIHVLCVGSVNMCTHVSSILTVDLISESVAKLFIKNFNNWFNIFVDSKTVYSFEQYIFCWQHLFHWQKCL